MSLSQLEQTLLSALEAQENELKLLGGRMNNMERDLMNALETRERELLKLLDSRMNSMQREIVELSHSLRECVDWQMGLIAHLNELQSLFDRAFRN